ncbi:hypothetical protein KGQ19_03690 [Catenulispora sp. NL8]|uniref:Uncharacterized protein n=1 Tax=Catenulispora pinistramenti TaxID=2705254 RepID=A0ABS5KI67_9ACTN|nr:hypothetical protein [Catenulispora pinistramenti]MBS2545963.1 hypothetical protein [Catenulispora pinistramenti]
MALPSSQTNMVPALVPEGAFIYRDRVGWVQVERVEESGPFVRIFTMGDTEPIQFLNTEDVAVCLPL